jgi:predicted O-methyltransferase YrrM
MRHLEAIDARDREDGTPRQKRLRQIPPETGKFIALLAASAPPGSLVEIGTSAGYSALWLALVCQQTGRSLTTYEILPEKAALASQTFQQAGVEAFVNLVEGDALLHLPGHAEIAFCFLDAEKEIYNACYEIVVPIMAPGGWLVADNAINHRQVLQPMLERAMSDERLDAMIVPVGKGLLVCRRI